MERLTAYAGFAQGGSE